MVTMTVVTDVPAVTAWVVAVVVVTVVTMTVVTDVPAVTVWVVTTVVVLADVAVPGMMSLCW